MQLVSSLPVNYSLLDVAQNSSGGAQAAIAPNPLIDYRTTTDTSSLQPRLRARHHRAKPNNSQIPNINHFITSTNHFHPEVRRAIVNPSTSRAMTVPTPATRTLVANNHNSTQTVWEKELQDEWDFEMAVHLTFCKVRD